MPFITSNAETNMLALIYGPPGSGKSYGITTWTRGPILLVQTEPGFVSALNHPGFRAKVQAGEHHIFTADSWDELTEWRFPGKFEAWLKKNGLVMPTLIVIDSLTWVMECIKEWACTKYPTESQRRDRSDRIPEKQTYLIMSEQVKQFVAAMRIWPCDKLIIAQSEMKELEEPGSKTTLWLPLILGKYSTKIAHDVDLVLFARRKEKGFIVETQETATHLGKARGLDLPKELPFSLDQIREQWEKVRN